MGDGIGHVAVTGVALRTAHRHLPHLDGVVVAVLGAILIEVIRERGHTNGDVALALLFYGGLAGGVMLTGIGGQGCVQAAGVICSGRSLTISVADVWVSIVLALVVVLICLGVGAQLFAVAQDRSSPRWRAST